MNNNSSRRNFIKKSILTTGVASVGTIGFSANSVISENSNSKLHREVWVAGISQMDLVTKTPQLMVDEITNIIEKIATYNPDIICLPEVFPFSNVQQQLSLSEKLEISREVLIHFSELAKKHNCYIICPTYTSENDKIYNSAVLFDRQGVRLGEYRKIHLTEEEINMGLYCGPSNPPLFKTDFGTIGIQICFDIMWDDGWKKLKVQGAEIVFWPSAYAGGVDINTKARQYKYIVATSTHKNTSKICDFTGEVIAKTGIWEDNYYCAPINMERAFLHIWPYVLNFDKIKKKYGRKIKITIYHEEEWAVIESLSPDILVSDVMKEFNFRTYDQLVSESEIAQEKHRH